MSLGDAPTEIGGSRRPRHSSWLKVKEGHPFLSGGSGVTAEVPESAERQAGDVGVGAHVHVDMDVELLGR